MLLDPAAARPAGAGGETDGAKQRAWQRRRRQVRLRVRRWCSVGVLAAALILAASVYQLQFNGFCGPDDYVPPPGEPKPAALVADDADEVYLEAER